MFFEICFRPATLWKKRRWHRCFPVYFVKFLRTPFFYRTPLVATSEPGTLLFAALLICWVSRAWYWTLRSDHIYVYIWMGFTLWRCHWVHLVSLTLTWNNHNILYSYLYCWLKSFNSNISTPIKTSRLIYNTNKLTGLYVVNCRRLGCSRKKTNKGVAMVFFGGLIKKRGGISKDDQEKIIWNSKGLNFCPWIFHNL